MNKQTIIPILLVVAYIAYDQFSDGGSPIAPKPAPPMGSEVLAAFEQTDNRQLAAQDSKLLGHVCSTLAEILKTDGQLNEPQLTTGVAIDNLRRNDRIYTFGGRSLGSKYPDLVTVLQNHFTERVGTSGGPIDDKQRAKWVTAFEQLASASHYAADNL